jgi:phenylacetic acid degradation operon negative regulatory protein
MKQMTSSEWIAQFLATEPPRSKSLMMTVFGDAVAPHGGTIWLGSLIELAAPFGVSDRLVRTSVFRLAQEGWLQANRDGRRSSYSIHPDALKRFERANHRIYEPIHAKWDGGWTLVISGGADIGAPQRAQLRKEMVWEGYAQVAQGLFAHPAGDVDGLKDILSRLGVQDKLFVCHATALPGMASRPLSDLVAEGWDLSEIVAAYQHFVETFEPLFALLRQGGALDPEAAFVIRTLLVHAYRRVQLHDPMLPVGLCPSPWPGTRAYELARDIYRYSYGAAEQHIMAVMRREDKDVPTANAAFHQRFEGLMRKA